MEEISPRSVTTTDEPALPAFIASRRAEARQYIVEQHCRLGELEAMLSHQVAHLGQQLAVARQAAASTEAELSENRAELEAATKKLRLDERGLAQLRRECEANADEVAYHRQRLQQKLAELEIERERLDELRAETKSQRLRIAQQLRSERAEHRRQLERERSELDQRRAALADAESLARQLEETRGQLSQAEASANQAQQQTTGEASEELRQALADMTRRYELAMEDLREQKRRLAEMEKQPASTPRAAPAGHADKLDWEAQKQRLLATLEADADDEDEEDEERRSERLNIREVIDHTEAVLMAKDREIDDLRQLLSAQSSNLGDVAVGATAFAEMLSADEIVRSERERLQQLQLEWEEKLRQAEIELSVQRAKIARERAEIEERQRLLDDHRRDRSPNEAGDTAKNKPQRGRWLARLGLKDDEGQG
jgi:hypothetical protein